MKSLLQNLGLLTGTLFLMFLIGECAIRMTDYEPVPDVARVMADYADMEPVVSERHQELGWINTSGQYSIVDYEAMWQDLTAVSDFASFSGEERTETIASLVRQNRTNQLTILEDGSRLTSLNPGDKTGPSILMAGCSFTYGLGLSDEETYPAQVSERLNAPVSNVATNGYGTYQSLLRIKHELDQNSYEYVTYGYIENHEFRNVGSYGHIFAMNVMPQAQKRVNVPFAKLSESGEIEPQKAESYPRPFLSGTSYLISFIADRYYRIKTLGREDYRQDLTDQILLEMNSVAVEHDARFILILLSYSDDNREALLGRLQTLGIDYVDCSVDDATESESMLPVVTHPDMTLNQHYARCFAEYFDQQ